MLKDDLAVTVFDSLIHIQVGKGNRVYFWKDRWLSGLSVQDIAPNVLAHICTRRRNRRTVQVALLQNRWIEDIQGALSPAAAVECVRLWLRIQNFSVDRDADQDDVFSWPCSSKGVHSASSTYERLQLGAIDFAAAEAIWKNGAPLKCKVFMWLTILDRQWTSARRFRHGLQAQSSTCFVCLQGEDSVEHLFTQCVHARQVWHTSFQDMAVAADPPTVDDSLEDWWLRERARFSAKTRKNFDALVILGCWELWKNRNAWVFNNLNLQFTPMQLASRVWDEFSAWTLGRRGVSGVFDPF
jgi:hypothetical protein